MQQHLNLLGLKVKDRITDTEGVVTSICFDLYGCIQAIIDCKVDEKHESKWMDVSRLEILDHTPVMNVPDFITPSPVADGKKGPADKPLP